MKPDPNEDPDVTEDAEVFAAEDYVQWLDELEAADDKDVRSWDI